MSLLLSISALAYIAHSQSAPFSPTDVATMRGYFEKNIGVSKADCLDDKGCHQGFVVAAPTNDNPDYYYHWQRDAGVSMHVLQYTANSSDTSWDKKFQDYVQWVVTVQTEKDPNNINVLGEPKFNPDASVYSSGWCRPQNDGPASRAIALIDYAFYQLSQGNSAYVNQYLYKHDSTLIYDEYDDSDFWDDGYDDFDYPRANLPNCTAVKIPDDAKVDCGYNGINSTQCVNRGCCWYEIHDNPNNDPWCFFANTTRPTPAPVPTPAPTPYAGVGTIVTDLNYVSSVWQETNNCDLWEEINGVLQFYTLMVQRFALLYGASLATKLGDSATASKWTSTANSMTSDIQSFDQNGVIQEKQRTYDCSVILGALYGGTPNSFLPNAATMYPPNNADILSTANATIAYFKTAFPLNVELDGQGKPGTFLGRYKDDKYPGCDSNGGSQGHIWILCSNALGELYYRNSGYYFDNKNNGRGILSDRLLSIVSDIVDKDMADAAIYLRQYIGKLDNLESEELSEIMVNIAGIFASQGDGQLSRVAEFVASPCVDHMSEQICEATTANGGGLEIGAHDLTWSYGTVLSAMYYRDQAIDEKGIKVWDEKIAMRYRKSKLELESEDCSKNICLGQCKD